jgi:hypothetical protein
MGKSRSQLRYVGQWPDGPASTNQSAEPTVAARRMAEAAIAKLNRFGATAVLDEADRAHLRSARILPSAARLTIERQGDLIEAYLIDRTIAALKRQQESGG